jgi:flavin reductase (DIM6/NTAB) family NADH-FMN oxidoreductase RutF
MPMNAFTNAMRRAVSGVSIVTTSGDFGRYGLTVSSMTSVSAEPPMLLVCVNKSSIAHDAIAGNRRFAINVLSARQQSLAASFAGSNRHGPAYDFSSGEWAVSSSGLPQLVNPAAVFECDLDSAVTAGTHSIFIGRVTKAWGADEMPLAYSNREYGVPVGLAAANSAAMSTKTVLEARQA